MKGCQLLAKKPMRRWVKRLPTLLTIGLALGITGLTVGSAATTTTENVYFTWARRVGSTDYDEGKSIFVDELGNVYTTGFFMGTVDFDPGPGTYNLTSTRGTDIFVSKLDASGNFVWARRMGGIYSDIGESLLVDGLENVYITGSFMKTVDFDPGIDMYNLTSSGYSDIFISKLGRGNMVYLPLVMRNILP